MTFTPRRWPRPSWTTVAALLITLYGALLRLDAFTAKYGTLDHPAWARIATQRVAPLARHVRPSTVVWGREARPYVGGDPITYLQFGREMTSFYQPGVREPVFLALTKGSLWALNGQDAGVSLASAIGSIAVVFATFLLGTAVASPLVGLAAAFIMAIEFEAITWSVDGWRDDTFSAAFVFAAWALVRLHKRPSFASALAAGILCGIACLTRITALSFVLPALAWIAIAGRGERRPRLGSAGLAFGLLAVVVGPYLLSCAIATGDPFIAINYHTKYYRYSEGQSIEQPMSAGEYVRQKFAHHPIATIDVGSTGLIVRPFVTKWNGLDPWMPWLDTLLWWSALTGMAVWLFTPQGRLLILILLSSLLPYAFTWNVGGGGQWRFTMHVYSLYVVAAAEAWWRVLSPGMWRSVPGHRWRVVAVAALAIIGVLTYAALPWYVAREAIARGEAVNIESGTRDAVFYRSGWSALRQDGAVTSRVSLQPQTSLHFPLPAVKPYDIVLRFDPVAPEVQQRVTVLFNRQLLGTLKLSWNPERVGSYRLSLPVAWTRAGDNEITLVPDTLVTAATGGPRYAWLDAAEKLGVRIWYLRVLD